jgi:AhpD family alkylhydroperoxidase
MSKVQEFNDYRQKMNEKIMSADNKVIKRFFNLDTNAYQEGAIDVKTKEMLGLACSLVLRCDDCVKYHLGKCMECGLNRRRNLRSICHCQPDWWLHCNSAFPESSRVLGGIKNG